MARSKGFKVTVTERGARAAFKILAPQVPSTARAVASAIPSQYNVGVLDGVTAAGRPSSLVTLMEPNALAIQAKHGTVTRAAAEKGLEITRYPPGGR